MFKKLIGTKQFYKQIFVLAIPIMIQNGITNFVNMLDNIMVGSVGNAQMTGVAICNQLIFVFNLCIFGAISGASIFGAQFYGKGDYKGVRDTLRFKILFCSVLTAIGIAIFCFFGDSLINTYLRGEGSPEEALLSFNCAKRYLLIMCIGLVPYALTQSYSSTLRESGRATMPMIAGLLAVGVNLVFNYILIFGKLGAPALGSDGAAIATVLSRFVEFFIIFLYTHLNSKNIKYIKGLYKTLLVPKSLVKQIAIKGSPLLINETFWAMGIATVNQCYSVKGLDVVAANNICQTFFNVFGVAFLSVGAALGIILGQMLGAGEIDKARDSSFKLIAFSVFVSAVVSTGYFFIAEYIPQFYNTTDTVRQMAKYLMQISAIAMPLDAFAHASYFTLRSGGKTFVTILFDSCFVWVVNVSVATVLCNYTSLSILAIYAIIQSLNLIKCVAGYILVKKGIWLNSIIDKN